MIDAFALSSVAATTVSLLDMADLDVDKEGWSGAVNFNLSSATGNTRNTVLGGRARLGYKRAALTHVGEAGGNFTETTTVAADGTETTDVTQNNWFAQYRLEMQTGDRTFVFGRTRYEEDQFSGFDRRVFVGLGLGHTLWKTERSDFQILVGPGYQYFERARPDPVPDDFRTTEGNLAFFFGQTYNQQLRENVSIEQSLDTTVTDANTTVALGTALRTNLTERLTSRIAYNVNHETDPPAGRQNTDTLLSVSLGYEF